MKIWAHRGCSQDYPENTMAAFARAAEIKHLTGIELDIQMTRDGEIVVIHDERVDRTTDGTGHVKDYTYAGLRKLSIETGSSRKEKIPSIQEVLDLVQDRMRKGLLLNIELKNSKVPYAGMEERIMELIAQRNLQGQVVYSSFYTLSLQRIREIAPKASVGVLDTKVSDCLYKKRGCFGWEFGGKKDIGTEEKSQMKNYEEAALHPYWKGMDLTGKQLAGQTVRAWFTGHLYPEKPTGTRLDLKRLEDMGITDVFLNEPEEYLI